MKSIYKIHDLTLCVSATVKTLPYNVWRDVSRFAFTSTELSNKYNGGWGLHKFASQPQLDKAIEVLKGAMFSEASESEWQEWIYASEETDQSKSTHAFYRQIEDLVRNRMNKYSDPAAKAMIRNDLCMIIDSVYNEG